MQSNGNRAGQSNSYTDPDEIDALKRQLTIHRRNLYTLQEQKAQYGDLDVPLRITNEIARQEEAIGQIEARLAELESGTSVSQTIPQASQPDQFSGTNNVHIDGRTQVAKVIEERGVDVDRVVEESSLKTQKLILRLGYFFAALLVLNLMLVLVLVLGWRFFGDQPTLHSYLEVVAAVLGIGLEVLLLAVTIQRKWSITDILHWLGTSRRWQIIIAIVTMTLLVVALWPQVSTTEVASLSEEPSLIQMATVDTPTSVLNDTIAYYDFNVISKNDTQCWRVRTMLDGVPLGTAVKSAPGKGRYGSGALEFKFTLLLAQSGVGGAQIDQMGEGPNCAKSVPMIPSTGQVELWVYLDAGASEGEGVTLQAEPFFAPINVIPAWLYGPAVDLKLNQWNRVCWDRSNSPSGVGFGGDDWSGQLQAFGLEIKFADPAPTTPYVGIVYIDDVRLIGNAEGEACP